MVASTIAHQLSQQVHMYVCTNKVPLIMRLAFSIGVVNTPWAAHLYVPASASVRLDSVSEKCVLLTDTESLGSHIPFLFQAKLATGLP